MDSIEELKQTLKEVQNTMDWANDFGIEFNSAEIFIGVLAIIADKLLSMIKSLGERLERSRFMREAREQAKSDSGEEPSSDSDSRPL